MIAVGAAAVLVIFGVVLVGVADRTPSDRASVEAGSPRLSALRDQSVPRLQAANLAEQARGMFFPVFDAKRQALAHDMFRHAIDLDPTLSDGYSGAAQTMATMAILSPDPDQMARSIEMAREDALKALELSTADP